MASKIPGVTHGPPQVVPAGVPFGGMTKPYNAMGGVAIASCTANMTRITMTPAIAWNGGSVVFGPTVTTLGDSGATAAVLNLCVAGNWQVAGSAIIVPPPGYMPLSKMFNGAGDIKNFTQLDCDSGLI